MITLDYNTIYVIIMAVGALILLITAEFLEKFRIVYGVFLSIGLLLIIVPPIVYYANVILYRVS